ncbi:MAG TPA: ABC transporter substrate-binding protein [Solirubrobacteraceae bacterium]|nr:ABC transporter substrate-binding protein [Solirubrobacteraceae bacterium]
MRLSVERLGMAACTLAMLVIAGCGSSSTSTTSKQPASTPATSEVASIAAQVPASIKHKGTLTVAADATYAPNEFIAPDGHTVEGMDVDLVKALGAVMGLKMNVVNQTFDSIIPGIQAGKYDLGASSFTDTKARQKVVDFVTYFSAGTSFYTKAQGGTPVGTLASLCGHTAAVEAGTTEQTDATAQSKKCKAAGKPAVTVLSYPNQNDVNLAVQSGRAQLGMADSPVAAYAVKRSNGLLKLVGQPYGTAPYGLALPKHAGMAKPVLAALKALMANGTYTKILAKWGIQAGAITNPTINGATS